MDAWIGHRLQVIAVDDQFPPGVAGVTVIRTLLAVTAQAVQVRSRTGQNQCRLASGRVTDDAHLISIDERRQHAVAQGRSDGFGNLDRPPVQIAQGAETAVILGVVAGVNHRHHHKTLARQRGGEVMQGQRGSGVAVGQHQHGESADGDFRVFTRLDGVTLESAGMFLFARWVEGDGTHRLQVQRVEKLHLVVADAPVRMRRRGGVHCIQAAEQANQ